MAGAICFTADSAQVALGDGRTVTGVCQKALPQEAMNDDEIVDAAAVKETLLQLKESGYLPTNLILVLHSSLILAKSAQVPLMKEKELSAFCKSQFAEFNATYDELVYDYSVLTPVDETGKCGRILCCAAEKKLLQSYVDLFASVGVKLNAIDISLNCAIKLARSLEPFSGQTFILEVVNGNNVVSLLFVEGEYVFSNSARLLDEAGSQGYAIDLSAKISSMIQFNRAQKTKREVDKVYVAGIDEQTRKMTEDALFGLNVELCMIPEYVNFQGDQQDYSLTRYFGPVSGLIRKGGR